MSKLIDEVGNHYGLLTVVMRDPDYVHGSAYWICKCACGREVSVPGIRLREGAVRSCGNHRSELIAMSEGKILEDIGDGNRAPYIKRN